MMSAPARIEMWPVFLAPRVGGGLIYFLSRMPELYQSVGMGFLDDSYFFLVIWFYYTQDTLGIMKNEVDWQPLLSVFSAKPIKMTKNVNFLLIIWQVVLSFMSYRFSQLKHTPLKIKNLFIYHLKCDYFKKMV
jgi:hypothetical protein